ncbi:hypothetical protein LGQ03_05225 [Loktanella sp. TSTF-M6]|uniref:Transcriptional activator HlyU n=1 Tax=Loktanella gaetbuli TaxID=2881335 RepID=A0ABS8BSB5_9RHOB|nr:HlyU family transcriptional regulator [Loktanella gaetbuli]MCB5198633.1 hypothetical protein [Loktanella gaetbuli]
MSWLSKLFGGGQSADPVTAEPQGEVYKGFTIIPTPIKADKAYRIGARIIGDVDGESREHQLIRADTLQSFDDAVAASIAKAKLMIDQQGAGLFNA